MGNRKITKKAIKGKENLHPSSRKAAQLTRVNLRVDKLKSQTKARKDYADAKLQRPLFFLHSLSSPHPLSLPSLKALITDVYLARFDSRIEEISSERRAGRPKPKEMLELEEIKRREWNEYESGMEVPDLTHGPTSRLMYSWVQSETSMNVSHIDLMRHIRVSPNGEVILTKKGKAEEMGMGAPLPGEVEGEGDDWTGLAQKEAVKQGMEVEVK
ncbi:uncharacterized protein I303_105010 [Kwoniella dejecticola CBS 10117]|uniref:Translation machinery-associated protein 16 n=1 Tax=Kwoniella dejecticola CBS 10117 TaxID=1296121 RepID=A0A1A6A3P7_9TREE|nr:translation machinery-associated protein 16 [Kwoniella dejecticola CBS 10117]OBR84685.1 translation machinery-associated protein 16 [Kwoniella dejecticola CBS 10117]